jgi:hypothetical protein
MRPLVQLVTADSLSSHTTALERPNARIYTDAWCFQLARIHAAISLSITRPTSSPFSARFISNIYGKPTTFTRLRSLKLPSLSPTRRIPHNVTEMVATVVGDSQLNTARRILAEIQLRINGFNTYG